MKALSIKQPWASLIVEGFKPVENRKRKWKHKGPLLIHASKTFDENGFIHIGQYFSYRDYKIALMSQKLTGGFIGHVEMTDCVTKHDSIFFSGPYGYVFKNPKQIELIPWKGQQGVFNVDLREFGFAEVNKHYGAWYDCYKCGEIYEKFPEEGECPRCKTVILPF